METNKLIAGIVAAAIAVIVLAGVLMPVLSDATKVSDTYTNEGVIHLEKYTTESPDLTLVWDYTKPAKITINSEEIDLPQDVQYLSLDMGNDWFVRYTLDAQRVSFITTNSSISASVANTTNMTVTLSEGTVSATNGTNTATGTYDDYLCITSNPNSAYVMKPAGSLAKMHGDSEFYAYGVTGNYAFKITGNIDDGATVTKIRGDPVTITDTAITYTPDSAHDDLYSLDKITFKYGSSTATYNMFVVPNTVTAERSVHLDPAMNTILSVIPIMIIVAVLLGVVAVFILRRE